MRITTIAFPPLGGYTFHMRWLFFLVMGFHSCTSFDRMVFLGIVDDSIREKRNEYIRRQVTLGASSECLVLQSGSIPFSRMETCPIGDFRSVDYDRMIKVEGRIHVWYVPSYVLEGHSNLEFYQDVTLGRGPFHNRSLKENILRQSMSQSQYQNRKIPTLQYSK
ncbi:hypothetical protein [Leptospira levettii]|uniref:hypothetical protein n=1 Tax=Leptospira levettii TaxID=2023178 RepID=UPI001FEE7783|nr:hypothetical protein [Leptospira levettii]